MINGPNNFFSFHSASAYFVFFSLFNRSMCRLGKNPKSAKGASHPQLIWKLFGSDVFFFSPPSQASGFFLLLYQIVPSSVFPPLHPPNGKNFFVATFIHASCCHSNSVLADFPRFRLTYSHFSSRSSYLRFLFSRIIDECFFHPSQESPLLPRIFFLNLLF